MHTAAVGAFAVLVGSTVAARDAWPHDVEQVSFLSTAAALTVNVAVAAVAIHGLAAKTKAGSRTPKLPLPRPATLVHGNVVIEDGDVIEAGIATAAATHSRLPALLRAFSDFSELVNNTPPITTPPLDGIALHSYLTYGASLSNLQTLDAMHDQPGGQVAAVFAARTLLEESVRLRWRYAVPGEEEFKARAKQYFDEYRQRQRQTIRILAGQGMKKDAVRLFELPANVLTPPGVDQIAKNRKPIPTLSVMLRSFGFYSYQPDWLEVPCSMLSQVTHATPLGYLHCLRFDDGEWIPNEMSVEMYALTLDVSAIGGGYLLGVSGAIFNNVAAPAQQQYRDLRAAATVVHHAARELHGLDAPPDTT